MIRINLLEEQRGTQRTAAVSVPSLPQENLLFYVLQGLIPLVAILVIGGWAMKNNATISQLNDDIAHEKAELERLKAVIELNNQLEKKRDLLRRKIEVISKLKRNQDVPVRMLDNLSRNLSEFLWLTDTKVKGRVLELRGRAQNEYAVAQFMRNLQNSTYFEKLKPKEIKQSRGVYDWTLSVSFVLPEELPARENQNRATSGRP